MEKNISESSAFKYEVLCHLQASVNALKMLIVKTKEDEEKWISLYNSQIELIQKELDKGEVGKFIDLSKMKNAVNKISN